MSILFGIDGTAEYIEYSESERNRTANYPPRPYGLPGYVPNYSDDFIDELNDVFCYSIYSSGDNYIVKLKVDYIKHNTTVAFPSVLFVKGEIKEMNIRDLAAIVLYAMGIEAPGFDEKGWTSQIPKRLFSDYECDYRDISHLTGAAPRISKKHHESEPA